MEGRRLRPAEAHHQPRGALDGGVVALIVVPRPVPLTTRGGNLQADGARIALPQRGRIDAEAPHLVVHHIAADDVRALGELVDDCQPFRLSPVQDHAALANRVLPTH